MYLDYIGGKNRSNCHDCQYCQDCKFRDCADSRCVLPCWQFWQSWQFLYLPWVARSGISNEPDSRRPNDKPPRASLLGGIGEVDLDDRSGYLRAPAFVALLDHLHLVFDAQLEFLQTHFLKLFVVRKISFFCQGIEALRVQRVFLGQPTKLFVAGKKLFANGIYHPEEPPACSLTER